MAFRVAGRHQVPLQAICAGEVAARRLMCHTSAGANARGEEAPGSELLVRKEHGVAGNAKRIGQRAAGGESEAGGEIPVEDGGTKRPLQLPSQGQPGSPLQANVGDENLCSDPHKRATSGPCLNGS